MTDQTMDEAPSDDTLALELGHIIWFLQTGAKIEDPDRLHETWKQDFPEMQQLASAVIEQMYNRGLTVTFYDRSLSHFGA